VPLDYGNSPRATPLIEGERVFLLGAFGHLHCLDLATGKLLWTSQLAEEFDAPRPHWGYAGSPILVGGKLIVQPGAGTAALVALDPATGDVLWESPGRKAAYAALIATSVAGRTQLIGCDATTLGGWDPETGKRLWEIKPDRDGDFNVPTPLRVGPRFLSVSESNGARLFAFDADGLPIAKPVATFATLCPDTHTPVLAGRHIVGLSEKLFCLDAETLTPVWTLSEPGLGEYASFLSDGKSRILALGDNGILALFDTASSKPLSVLRVCEENAHLLAHPAIVGNRLYLRLGQRLVCLTL
jgi:outer membrane protein assembly factor BamB